MANKETRYVFVISIMGVAENLRDAWEKAKEGFYEDPGNPPDKVLPTHPNTTADPDEYYVIKDIESDEPEVTPPP